MSNSRRGRGGGRPSGSRPSGTGGSKSRSTGSSGPAKRARPTRRQARTGPPVVGKRPSQPWLLFVVGLLWFGAAVGALVGIHRSWKIVPIICFAGVGFLYLRGAAGSYLRRPAPPDEK